jgi:hypothetical protein
VHIFVGAFRMDVMASRNVGIYSDVKILSVFMFSPCHRIDRLYTSPILISH